MHTLRRNKISERGHSTYIYYSRYQKNLILIHITFYFILFYREQNKNEVQQQRGNYK
jgi:hypothetical protein